jgi:hypothetical protein
MSAGVCSGASAPRLFELSVIVQTRREPVYAQKFEVTDSRRKEGWRRHDVFGHIGTAVWRSLTWTSL